MDFRREVARLARCQCPRNPALAEELAAHVLWQIVRGRFDPQRGPFEGWCWRVLANARRTAWQQQRRWRGLPFDLMDPRTPLNLSDQEERVVALFGRADLCRIARWTAEIRVLLLSRSHLWPKYPTADWQRSCDACGIVAPFPTFGVDTPENEQYVALATALSVRVNTMHQRWHRWRPKLMELDFVRELAADYGKEMPES